MASLAGHYGKGSMPKPKAMKRAAKVRKVMHEFNRGKLKSGSGRKVMSRKQAVAIALSMARKAGLLAWRRTAGIGR